jgi:hypothetical protein
VVSRLSVLITVLMSMTAIEARAEWPDANRAAFTEKCLPACEARRKTSHPEKCSIFCDCFLATTEKLFPDPGDLERQLDIKPETAAITRFKAIAPSCNKSAGFTSN